MLPIIENKNIKIVLIVRGVTINIILKPYVIFSNLLFQVKTFCYSVIQYAFFIFHTEITSHINKSLWIGLNDKENEGSFEWEDGSTVS